MLFAVGEELIDHVHHAAEHGGSNGLAFLFVVRARPHLVERFRRLSHVKSPDGPRRRLRPGRHLGHAQHGVDTERVVQMVQQTSRIAVEQDWGLTRGPDADGLHLGLVDGT